MNATTKAIIGRLPKKPLLQPGDLAAAYGMATVLPILNAIKAGESAANVVSGRYYIANEEAQRYIEENEYKAEEGTEKEKGER